MGQKQNIFKKIAAAQATGGGNYIRDGRGELVVKKLEIKDLYKGDTFIGEFKVESSESYPDAVDEKTGKPIPANAPGTSCSYIQQLDQFESAPGNVKAFVLALLGQEDASDDEFAVALEELTNQEEGAKSQLTGEVMSVNSARGMRIRYETYRKPVQKGKNAGKMLTLVRFTHVDQTAEQIEATRAELDGEADKAAA